MPGSFFIKNFAQYLRAKRNMKYTFAVLNIVHKPLNIKAVKYTSTLTKIMRR